MPNYRKLTLDSILKTTLGLFLFLLPWQTIWIVQERMVGGVKWQYGTIGFYATEFLLWVNVILFIFWFVRKYKVEREKGKVRFEFSKDRMFVLSVLIFVLYYFATFFWAGDQDLAFQSAMHILEASLLFFMLYLGPLDFDNGAKWLVSGAVVQSLLGIWQFLTQSTFEFKWLGLSAYNIWEGGTSVVEAGNFGRWLRAYGSFPHPNMFGGYLGLTFLATLVLRFRLKFKNKFNESLFFFVPAVQLTALFFTFSRSAWLSALFILLFYLYIVKRRSGEKALRFRLVTYAWVLLLIMATIFMPLVKSRTAMNSRLEVKSTSERVVGYQEAWRIFKDNTLFGVGAGNYTVKLIEANPNLSAWNYQPVHNVFFLGLTEIGVVGLALLLLVFLIFCKMQTILVWSDCLGFVLFLLLATPLMLLDHYLFSSFTGLTILMIYLALFLRVYPVSFNR